MVIEMEGKKNVQSTLEAGGNSWNSSTNNFVFLGLLSLYI